MTNADKIREMDDGQLAMFLCDMMACSVCKFNTHDGCGLHRWSSAPAESEEWEWAKSRKSLDAIASQAQCFALSQVLYQVVQEAFILLSCGSEWPHF